MLWHKGKILILFLVLVLTSVYIPNRHKDSNINLFLKLITMQSTQSISYFDVHSVLKKVQTRKWKTNQHSPISEPAFQNTNNMVHQQIWHTAVRLEMTCWDGGLITMQSTQQMNSARRHVKRWHHLLECLCRLVTQMPLAEHTGLCSNVSTC